MAGDHRGRQLRVSGHNILNGFNLSTFRYLLGPHTRCHHSDVSTWPCLNCSVSIPKSIVHTLVLLYHWEGQFVCGMEGCKTFTKISNLQAHKALWTIAIHATFCTFVCS